jgi:hypothetical protein
MSDLRCVANRKVAVTDDRNLARTSPFPCDDRQTDSTFKPSRRQFLLLLDLEHLLDLVQALGHTIHDCPGGGFIGLV